MSDIMIQIRDGTDTERGGVTDVLLVDHDPGTARLLGLAFDEFGRRTRLQVATDGEEAFEVLDAGTRSPRPDVVVLDVDNTVFDGREVLRTIRETESDLLPVVVFSRNDDPTMVQECYELGATAYLVKPHGYEGLKAVVNVASRVAEGAEFGAAVRSEAN